MFRLAIWELPCLSFSKWLLLMFSLSLMSFLTQGTCLQEKSWNLIFWDDDHHHHYFPSSSQGLLDEVRVDVTSYCEYSQQGLNVPPLNNCCYDWKSLMDRSHHFPIPLRHFHIPRLICRCQSCLFPEWEMQLLKASKLHCLHFSQQQF